ncbi:protein phosphatase 2C domain-containing protein [Demequina sp. SYSU T00068]|uniref:protein phosphatase 2C domain-containing protein n=1 Tax=Demequina lignilytica TaxID=3051663 RepID=UPI00261B48ED|nr:protein phosphatase 2C domain-containing protein [Demequina sp. SYSU T00068]MDN4489688.1 protein phosphatase 2C domain-containing protein [Demequina sp. SYSU T00068]
MSGWRFSSSAVQDKGVRTRQNDTYLLTRNVVALADGAGSSSEARALADAVVDHAARVLSPPASGGLTAIEVARGLEVFRYSGGDVTPAAATTLLAAAVDATGMLWMVSLGDSVATSIRGGSILAQSAAHNRAAQESLQGGVPALGDEARLTRFMGLSGPVGAADIQVQRALPGDVIVLATDGFLPYLTMPILLEAVRRHRAPEAIVLAAAEHLPSESGDLGDNATIVVAVVEEM